MGWDTTATAVGTSAAAIVTAVMAYQTRRVATRTGREAKATETLATASLRAAEATRELAAQGALGYRPELAAEIVEGPRGGGEPPTYDMGVKLVNVGAGPGLGCIFAAQRDGLWCATAQIHISPNDNRTVKASQRAGEPEHSWWRPEEEGRSPPHYVFFCRDVLDRRYRFMIDDLGNVLGPEVRGPEDLRAPSSLHWSTDIRLWGPPTERSAPM
jgi:hypothetical protein